MLTLHACYVDRAIGGGPCVSKPRERRGFVSGCQSCLVHAAALAYLDVLTRAGLNDHFKYYRVVKSVFGYLRAERLLTGLELFRTIQEIESRWKCGVRAVVTHNKPAVVDAISQVVVISFCVSEGAESPDDILMSDWHSGIVLSMSDDLIRIKNSCSYNTHAPVSFEFKLSDLKVKYFTTVRGGTHSAQFARVHLFLLI